MLQAGLAASPGGDLEPVGAWEFDDPANLLKASAGNDLVLAGQHIAIPGIGAGDGAARIGIGSYYRCQHGIAPNGGGGFVNEYTLLFDFRIPRLGPWYCFFQTNPANANDGDCFVRASDGAIGVGQTGYSGARAQPGVWQRLLVSVDHATGVYHIYLDGDWILDGAPQSIDGRFALDPTMLFFADDNGEDASIDVTRIAVFNRALTASEAVTLGSPQVNDPTNRPPHVVPGAAGPDLVGTGKVTAFTFRATDPDSEKAQVRVDWADGEVSSWSDLADSGQAVLHSHAYRLPGKYHLRAIARDARGKLGVWTDIQTIEAEGEVAVELLTPPYLQNVKPDGITIMWECDVALGAEVRYGSGPALDGVQTATVVASGAGTHIYRAVLRRLQPRTTYRYEIGVGRTVHPGGTFTTAPAGHTDFSFAVWADSQGSNHGAYAADPLEPTKSMMTHMGASGIHFAVGAGDLAENGASYSDTRQYYLDRVMRRLGGAVPCFPAWGNHDGGRNTVIRKFADLPSQDRPGFDPGYGSYSFDYGGCHFICLDYASAVSDIRTWLEGDLQSEANRQARFTFLFVHVPPYCELWINGDALFRSELVPLLEAYGVDACFSGHTHEYSRGYLNGVHYCVTGGGSWLDLPWASSHSRCAPIRSNFRRRADQRVCPGRGEGRLIRCVHDRFQARRDRAGRARHLCQHGRAEPAAYQ